MGLGEPEDEPRQDERRDGQDGERHPPGERRHVPGDGKPRPRPEQLAGEHVAVDAAALGAAEVVAHEGGHDRPGGGGDHAQHQAGEQQAAERARRGAPDHGRAPGGDGAAEEPRPPGEVGQDAERDAGRRGHEGAHGHQQADVGVGDAEVVAQVQGGGTHGGGVGAAQAQHAGEEDDHLAPEGAADLELEAVLRPAGLAAHQAPGGGDDGVALEAGRGPALPAGRGLPRPRPPRRRLPRRRLSWRRPSRRRPPCGRPAHLRSRESRRSASTRPPVWQARAVVDLVAVVGDPAAAARRSAGTAGRRARGWRSGPRAWPPRGRRSARARCPAPRSSTDRTASSSPARPSASSERSEAKGGARARCRMSSVWPRPMPATTRWSRSQVCRWRVLSSVVTSSAKAGSEGLGAEGGQRPVVAGGEHPPPGLALGAVLAHQHAERPAVGRAEDQPHHRAPGLGGLGRILEVDAAGLGQVERHPEPAPEVEHARTSLAGSPARASGPTRSSGSGAPSSGR